MAKYLDQPVREAVEELTGMSGTSPESVYLSSVWAEQREAYGSMKAWYDGDEWQRVIENQRDSVTGESSLYWPLQLNPIAKVCRVHRAVMLGMLSDTLDEPPVTTTVTRTGLSTAQREQAAKLESFINSLWKTSNAHSILYEAMLLEQIYGGHVFRVHWDPTNKALPYRLCIQSMKNPGWFFAKAVNPMNDWDLIEAYVGYYIPADVAKATYGISAGSKDKVLYMEHWTKDRFRFTVDGQVPTLELNGEEYPLDQENTWGIIPIVYIPHERDGSYLGRSVVDGNSSLVGLAKELNARMADKGEILQDARSLPWIKNARQTGGLSTRGVMLRGRNVEFIDLGDATRIPGAAEPEAGIMEPKGLPETVASFTDEVEHWIQQQGDVAAPAVGDDDVSGGRITGPVTAYRMWPTMQHTMTERAMFSDGMRQIARIAIAIVLDKQKDKDGGFDAFGAMNPGLTEEMQLFGLGTSWRPMIPIEETQEGEMLNDQLRAGGISLLTYLQRRGVADPEAEADRIWADIERTKEIEQKFAPKEASNAGQEPVRKKDS